VKADLHLHSRYSDGWVWPDELAGRAAAAGLELVALTDHDSMEGVAEFRAACVRWGLVSVASAAIDCVAPEIGYSGEVLAYFPAGRTSARPRFCANAFAPGRSGRNASSPAHASATATQCRALRNSVASWPAARTPGGGF